MRVIFLRHSAKSGGVPTWIADISQSLNSKADIKAQSIEPSFAHLSLIRQADIIHICTFNPKILAIVCLGRIIRKPIIATVHSDYIATYKTSYFLKRFLAVFLSDISLLLANKITVPSKYLLKTLAKKRPHLKNKLVFIKNGVNQEQIKKIPKMPRKKLGIKKNDFLIVEVTDFYYPEKAKGVDLLVDAFNFTKQENKKLKLIIVGGRKYFKSYKRKYESESIKFTGQIKREEVISIIKAADLVVHCSFLDNAPLSLIEAMVCKKPIIATQVGAVKELLGEAGVICRPNQLALQIKKTISSPETLRDLQKKSNKKSKMYDSDQISQNLLMLYNSVIR
jgi:glycosyltransferase involved in cell wall biosynthesis